MINIAHETSPNSPNYLGGKGHLLRLRIHPNPAPKDTFL